MDSSYDPNRDASGLSSEKIAILRIYLFEGQAYYIVPTVEAEYKRIKESGRLDSHESLHEVLLLDYQWDIDADALAKRISELKIHHSKYNDCRVIAEVEQGGIKILLTCDEDMIHHLNSLTPTKLMRPTELWKELNIQPGTRPKTAPHHTNPLSKKNWWLLNET
jgi:hypothetical protein